MLYYKTGTLEDQLKELTRSIENKEFTQLIKTAFKQEENKDFILSELVKNTKLLTNINQFRIAGSVICTLYHDSPLEELEMAFKSFKDSIDEHVTDDVLLLEINEFIFNLNISNKLQLDALLSLIKSVNQARHDLDLIDLYQQSSRFLASLVDDKPSMLKVLAKFYEAFQTKENSNSFLAQIAIEIIENKLCTQGAESKWIEKSVKNILEDCRYNICNIEYILRKISDKNTSDHLFFRIFQLVYESMDQDSLSSFLQLNAAWVAKNIEVSPQTLIHKLRLMKLSTLSIKKSSTSMDEYGVELSYTEIKTELNIEKAEVEAYILDAIFHELLDVELDQLRETVRIKGSLDLKLNSDELKKLAMEHVKCYNRAIEIASKE